MGPKNIQRARKTFLVFFFWRKTYRLYITTTLILVKETAVVVEKRNSREGENETDSLMRTYESQ